MALSRKTEKRAIGAIENIINDHPTMESHIKRGDKDLSWDGYIRIFKDNLATSDKKNFLADIPVQVKGKAQDDNKYLQQDRIKYSVDLDDLRVYQQMSGCLFFVVYMCENGSDTKIFYSSLYPSKIKYYLSIAEKRENKTSITLPFVSLEPTSNDLDILCRQFAFESRKQGPGNGQIILHSIQGDQIKNVKKFTATTFGKGTYFDLLKQISTGDAAIYAINDDSGIQYPVITGELIATIKNSKEGPIRINGKEYYKCYDSKIVVTSPGSPEYVKGGIFEIIPSENITFRFSESKVNIKFKPAGDLIHIKDDATFLLDLIIAQEIEISGNLLPLNGVNYSENFTDQLKMFINIGNLFEKIGLDLGIKFGDLNDDDKKQIDILVGIQEGRINIGIAGQRNVYPWKFRDKYWPVIIDNTGESAVLCSYVYNPNVKVVVESKKDNSGKDQFTLDKNFCIIPTFADLPAEQLANLYYYDYEAMYEQIDQVVINKETSDYMNTAALRLISAYDLNQDEKLLEMAEDILKRLMTDDTSSIIYPINICQIMIRKNGKADRDSLKLVDGIYRVMESKSGEKNSDHVLLHASRYCIAVINQNLDEADRLYESLTLKEKESIDNYPIRTLHLKLKG